MTPSHRAEPAGRQGAAATAPADVRAAGVRATGLGRDYPGDGRATIALDRVDLVAAPGELVVVRGASGSGKSTLLRLLAGLDRPSRGEVTLDGIRLDTASDDDLAVLRRERFGIVFQSFGLLSVLTAAENVELPLRLTRTAPPTRAARVAELLELVGLTEHAAQRPDELSGGQQQRVGIARALAANPSVLLADEPTAQLDSVTGERILALLEDTVRSRGVAAVVATHDDGLAERATRVVELSRLGGPATSTG